MMRSSLFLLDVLLKTLSTMLRCVSKSWNDLIINPSFYSHHLKQSMENAPQLLIVDRRLLRERRSIVRFVSVDTEVEDGERNELYNDIFPDLYWCYRLVICYIWFGLHFNKRLSCFSCHATSV